MKMRKAEPPPRSTHSLFCLALVARKGRGRDVDGAQGEMDDRRSRRSGGSRSRSSRREEQEVRGAGGERSRIMSRMLHKKDECGDAHRHDDAALGVQGTLSRVAWPNVAWGRVGVLTGTVWPDASGASWSCAARELRSARLTRQSQSSI